MIRKLCDLIARYWEILIYVFFGGLTTVVNFVIYWPLMNWVGLPAWFSNSAAWVVAVAFAFLTNKPFVFRSHDWSWKVLQGEIISFLGCRIGSWLIQTVLLFLTVDVLHWHETLWWFATSILVVVVNYIGSKLLVFRGN